jgi:hypothetical protein
MLFDADREGVSPREMVREILQIDPDRELEQAQRVRASHLARARWMNGSGYKQLPDDPWLGYEKPTQNPPL